MRGQLVDQLDENETAESIFDSTGPTLADARFEVPGSWLWIQFSSVGNQRLGKMLDQRGNRGNPKPYLRNTNVQWMRFDLADIKELLLEDDELDEFRLMPGDLLICEGGEPGRCAIWMDPDREMYFQKALHRVRPRSGILPHYLAICLLTDARNGVLARHFTGATIKHLTGRSLANYSIPLPPTAEQKRIVAKVDALMAQCDRLEAQLSERDTRQADLARAALARFTESPTPANLHLLFHDSFTLTPADLRKTILSLAVFGKLVPNQGAWETVSLSDAAAEIVDCPHSTPKWTNEGKICVRTNQFRPGCLDLTASRFVSEKTYLERIQRLEPREDDILYSREGGILGVACRVPSGAEICLGQRMMLIRAGDKLVPAFLELVLNSPLITEAARSRTTGGAAPRVNVSTVKAYSIPIPPLDEQRRIVAKVDRLMALVDEWEARLTATRTTATKLLDALVAGLTEASTARPDLSLGHRPGTRNAKKPEG